MFVLILGIIGIAVQVGIVLAIGWVYLKIVDTLFVWLRILLYKMTLGYCDYLVYVEKVKYNMLDADHEELEQERNKGRMIVEVLPESKEETFDDWWDSLNKRMDAKKYAREINHVSMELLPLKRSCKQQRRR